MTPPVVIPEPGTDRIARHMPSQAAYRYGMMLLIVGALANWLVVTSKYPDPIRFLGVACVIIGATLICAAMCWWVSGPQPAIYGCRGGQGSQDSDIHVINMEQSEAASVKPPDYDAVAAAPPPTYTEAIKLDPRLLLPGVHQEKSCQAAGQPQPPPYSSS